MPESSNKYRPNVSAIVLNEKNEILLCERNDITGAWQPPQGGIDGEESPLEALKREVEEEIGIQEFELIDSLPEPLFYDWPEELHRDGFIGQKQWYFLIKINSPINLTNNNEHVEFQNYKLVGINEFNNSVTGFKAETYKLALKEFVKRNTGKINFEN